MSRSRQTPVTTGWLSRLAIELARGRHVLVHGDVADDVVWQDEPTRLSAALHALLCAQLRYRHLGWYSADAGLCFHGREGARRAQALLAQIGHDADVEGAAQADAAVAAMRGEDPDAVAEDDDAASLDAFATIHAIVTQARESAIVVIDAAELALPQPLEGPQERRALDRLRTTLGSLPGTAGDGRFPNAVVLLAGRLEEVPDVIRSHPAVAHLPAIAPTHRERVAMLARLATGFHDVGTLSDAARGERVAELSRLTDGWNVRSLLALRSASEVEQLSLARPRELMVRVRDGVTRDPWEALTTEKLQRARAVLSAELMGQDAVIDEVLQHLRVGKLDIRCESARGTTRAPRVRLLLVGGTGVGKTELAKALARLVFDDADAIVRLDMSEFQMPHSVERFGGAPPGYVGHEAGGELTEQVRRRPFCVVLLDEIEKADAGVWDRLLHLVDDGRLTDGQGRTTSFADTILLMTSNLGAKQVADRSTASDALSYGEIDDMCRRAVERFISQPPDPVTRRGLGRPELYGRLAGSIVVFDALRAPVVDAIVAKLSGQYVERARERRGLQLDVDVASLAAAVRAALGPPGTWNGRSIKDELARRLERPLADQILAGELARGAAGRVTFDDSGRALLTLT
jgi:ATP-dependent Clp protease ATP-binding subunit ClpB